MDKALALQLKDYHGTFLKQVRGTCFETEKEEIMRRSKAPLEHTFNNHEFCKSSWCYKMQADEKGVPYTPPAHRPFYNKIDDLGMYMQLQETLGPFGTEETIEESLHPFETNLI